MPKDGMTKATILKQYLKAILVLVLCYILQPVVAGEYPSSNSHYTVFVRPELLFGKTLSANSGFPATRLQNIYMVSIGRRVTRTDLSWPAFFNYPEIGLSLSKTTFGQDAIIGNAYTLMPFISVNTSRRLNKALHVRMGLGTSYFTAFYDKKRNPTNKAIGSHFTWSFLASADYSLVTTPHFDLRMEAAFVHHSNGHTQLPNLGLNSLLLGITSNFYLSANEPSPSHLHQRKVRNYPHRFFYTLRTGLGVHEFGDPGTPLEGIKKAVYSFSLAGGVILQKVIKVSWGFTYRFYEHYYNYILNFEPQPYLSRPFLNASNLYVFAGCEFLLGHVGIDTEIGVNLFKPFYSEHHRMWEADGGLSYWLKRTFASRLGLKLYLFNNERRPANNAYIGCHINANLGQADFSELSIGIVHLIGRNLKGRFPLVR